MVKAEGWWEWGSKFNTWTWQKITFWDFNEFSTRTFSNHLMMCSDLFHDILHWLINQWRDCLRDSLDNLPPSSNLKYWTSERLRDWQSLTDWQTDRGWGYERLTEAENLRDWQRLRIWETDRGWELERLTEAENLRDWQKLTRRSWETDRGWEHERLTEADTVRNWDRIWQRVRDRERLIKKISIS